MNRPGFSGHPRCNAALYALTAAQDRVVPGSINARTLGYAVGACGHQYRAVGREEPGFDRGPLLFGETRVVGADAVPAQGDGQFAGDAFNAFAGAAEDGGGEQAVHTSTTDQKKRMLQILSNPHDFVSGEPGAVQTIFNLLFFGQLADLSHDEGIARFVNVLDSPATG